MIPTAQSKPQISKRSVANCNLWITCSVQCVGDGPSAILSDENGILPLLVCRRLLLTDARLFLQIDIFNYTLSRLFFLAELMSSQVKWGEQGRRSWLIWRLKWVWRGKRKKPFSRRASPAVSLFVDAVYFSRSTLCPPLMGAFLLFSQSALQGFTCCNSAPEPVRSLGLTHSVRCCLEL